MNALTQPRRLIDAGSQSTSRPTPEPLTPIAGGAEGIPPFQAPAWWRYDVDPATGVSRATYPGEVAGITVGPGTALLNPTITGGTVTNAVVSPNSNVGRNLLHNALFNVQQRGTGSWTTNSAYTADRWRVYSNVSTYSAVLAPISDAGRAQIGDEAALYYWSSGNVTGTAGAGDYVFLLQLIEGVRRLAGKTVTVSFYATVASGTPKIGICLSQIFGTGGSPSAQVSVTGQAVTLSTTWARYSATFTLPSASGKTLGTNGDDCTQLELWFTSGTNFTSRTGGIGVQSANFVLWGIQLELGTVAQSLDKPDPQTDLANCQRFYTTGIIIFQGNATASTTAAVSYTLPVTMRGTPTCVITSTGGTANITSPVVVPAAAFPTTVLVAQGLATATGNTVMQYSFTASADL